MIDKRFMRQVHSLANCCEAFLWSGLVKAESESESEPGVRRGVSNHTHRCTNKT